MGLKLLSKFRLSFILVMLLFGITKTAHATHVEGGDITYQCLGGNQYKVTMSLYRDCAGVAAPTNVSLNFTSVTCGLNFNATLNKIPGTGVEVTPICPTMLTVCSGGTFPGVQEYIYQATVTLPPCSDWVMSYSISARNNAIGTIVAPGSQNMYIEAKLNNLAFPCDNSPHFTNRPVPFICVGQPYCFNNGAVDPDGDLLVYSLITPRTSPTATVTYIAPYSAAQPLASTPPVTFNTATGDICMTPTLVQITVFAVLVKSYRGGVLVGSVERDIELTTVTCTNNNPSLNGINNTGVYTLNACAGVPISFNIPSFDPDAAQITTLTWNAGITGATFNPGTGTRPTGVFSWTPTMADVSASPHCFTVTVKDNNCPFIGSQTYSFCISVGGFTTTTSSVNATCTAHNGSATVNVTGGVPPLVYSWSPSGGTGATASGLAAGVYTYTVTDAFGCNKTGTVTVNANPGGTAAVSSFTNVSCNGGNNGSITVSMGGPATPPFTYAWTPSSAGTAATATNLVSGSYTCVVTDANGCTSTVTQAITQPAVLTVSPTFINVGCFGASTGTATATPAGGTGPYSYLWMPGAFNTASINSLSIGTYTVTVTDAKGCTVSGTANITQPPALSISPTTVGANCGLANGSASVTGTGGFAPYTWSWSNGQTGPNATGLSAGTYTVTLTDANLCTKTAPVTINSIAGPTAAITTFTNVACFGGNTGNATVTVTGGTAPFTYLWSNGQTTPTANNLVAGIYSVTATDAHGCTAAANITIIQPSVLVANAVSSNPVCFAGTNGTATASAVGGTPGYTYVWTASGSPTTPVITGLSAGTYNVTITDAHGCIKNTSVTLTNPPTVNTTVTTTPVSCNGVCDGTATAVSSSGTAPYTFSWNNPAHQTTATATGLCAGSYTVTVADANGCPSQAVATITQPVVLTSAISSTGNLTCYGVCTGFAQVTAGGGTAPYTYNWMPGAITSATATSLCAGSYTCTVTDARGCTSIAIANITQPAQLLATVTGTNINCFGSCDGTGTITFSGGTPPYNFLWTPSMQTIFNPVNLCPGVNTGTITDANGCAVSGSVTLTQAFTPLVVAISTTNSNCGQPNGSACASASGGLAPYTYIWNDSAVTQAACANGIPAGTYSVDVTDANGCVVTMVANVNDISAPAVAIVSHTDLLCNGFTNATATTSISGGAPPYTVLWTAGGQTVPNPTNLSGGVNTITVTDTAGCVSSTSVTILEPPPINHAISSISNVSCFGICNGSATVVAAGGTGALSYAWNDPASQTTTTASALCAGNYTVIITDANGCTALDSAAIIAQPTTLAISSSSVTNITCFGDNNGSITTAASGGTPFYTFSWTPSVSTAPVANTLAPGTYTLTVTDFNGCTVTQNWTVTQPPLLTDTFSLIAATCSLANGSAVITPSGGTSPYLYQWNDPALQITPTATGLYAGNYTAIVTDAHGCTVSHNYVVPDLSGPTIDSVTTTSVLCYSGNTGTATVHVTPGTGTAPLTYNWTPGSLASPTANGLIQGVYNILVTDANGCTATGVGIVAQPPLLQLFVSQNDTICFGDTAQVYATASGGTPAYNYFWPGTSGIGFTGAGPHMVIPTSTTTYTSQVLDNKGCSVGPLNMTVYVKPPLTVHATDTSVCSGDAALLNALPGGGNTGPYTFSWSNSITTQSQSVTPPAGTTSINYIVTVNDGCSSPVTDTSTVTINPGSIGVFGIADTTGCEPLSVNFIGTSNNGITYTWDFGDSGTGSGFSTSHVYNIPGSYNVTLTVTTAAGCNTLITNPSTIMVYPLPTADFSYTPNPVSTIAPLTSFIDQSSPVVAWNWNFGDPASTSNTSFLENPTHSFYSAGTFNVLLIVTSQYGCIDSTVKQVEVVDDFVFYAPNSFTPNDDDINDIFLPKGVGYDTGTFNFYIFDRWGNLIFYSDDYTKGWDGKANHGSEMAQQDVYVWKVNLTDNTGKKHNYIGHVTIVK